MRLELTQHPVRDQTSMVRASAVRLLALLLAAVLLTACADGLAPDAERGRDSDASRESVVTDLQATQTWNLVHGTPESTPEPEE